MAVVPCALRPCAASAPGLCVDGAATDRRACGCDDERDPRRVECEDQARAGLDAALANLAGWLSRRPEECFFAGPRAFRHIAARVSAESVSRPQLLYSSSFVCAMAIAWLLCWATTWPRATAPRQSRTDSPTLNNALPHEPVRSRS